MDKSRSSLTKSDGTHIVKTKRSLADGGVLTKIRTEKYIDEDATACPDSPNNNTRTHIIKTQTKRMNNTGGLSFTTTTKEKMMQENQPVTYTKVLPDGSRIIKTKKITNGPIITTTTVHLTNMPKKSKKQEDDVTQSMPELYTRDCDDNEPPLPLQYLTVESDDELQKVKVYDNSMPELYTREDGDDDVPPVPLQYMGESNGKTQEDRDAIPKIYIRKTDDTPPLLPFQYINEDDEVQKKIHGPQGRYDDDDNEIDRHILDSILNRKTDDAVAEDNMPINDAEIQVRGTNLSRLAESVSDEEEGLAVARPVYSEEGGSIYDAEEYTPIDKVPFYKQRKYILWTVIALLIISVIVVVSVVFATKTAVVDDQGQPLPQVSERETYLKSYIHLNVLQRDATWEEMAPDDPRQQAFDWVVYDDEQAELERPDRRLSQRYVLALLAFALDSLEWKHTKYWLSSEISECNWYGVSCVDDQVVSLNMTDNNLIGMIPPEISKLNLTKLLMSRNCLVGTILPELGSMGNLVQLDLSYNGLSGTFPTDTSKLRHLVKLNIAEQYYNDHACTSSDDTVINTMYSHGIESNGQNMGITGSILGPQIENMMSLEEIIIQGNYFSGSISSKIGSLKQLAILSAGVNNLSGSLPKEITQLTNLRQLLLDSNYISGSLPDEIGNMSLETIRVLQGRLFTYGSVL